MINTCAVVRDTNCKTRSPES